MVHSSATATPTPERYNPKDWVVFRRGQLANKTGQVIAILGDAFEPHQGPQILRVQLTDGDIVDCGSAIVTTSPLKTLTKPLVLPSFILSTKQAASTPGVIQIAGVSYSYWTIGSNPTGGRIVRLWKHGERPESPDGHSVTIAYDGAVSCTCPDYNFRRRYCKHITAVKTLQLDQH